jgi:hypothetical protein
MPLSAIALLLLAGCASGARPAAVFKGGADGSRSALVVALGPEKDGASRVSLTGSILQASVIMGEAKSEGDGWRIGLTRLDWFNNWANGWTEASFLLDGTLLLQGGSAGWTLLIEKAPQLDSVESASIRYFDGYVRDAKGQTEFSRRWDRIQAVAGDMLTRPSAAALAKDSRALKRYLSPKRPGDDSPENLAEPLRVLRDSGTLLRDYKESPGLWPLALAWKDFWERADIPIAVYP